MGSNRTVMVVGLILVLGGALLLAGNLFNFNAWVLCWPVGLIGLGIWFLVRPVTHLAGAASTFRFIGDLHRSGPWQVANEELTQFVGDIRLDLTQAAIASGQTSLRISGFVGDVTLIVPPGVGVELVSAAFVNEINFFGQHRDLIFSPVTISTPGFAAAERRLRVETNYFVADINIRQG